jgi:hypothetical protein
MKRKNPDAKLGDAMKAASKRKAEMWYCAFSKKRAKNVKKDHLF